MSGILRIRYKGKVYELPHHTEQGEIGGRPLQIIEWRGLEVRAESLERLAEKIHDRIDRESQVTCTELGCEALGEVMICYNAAYTSCARYRAKQIVRKST
jgi:hypothetical protein